MAQQRKKLRDLIHILKDKASLIRATLSIKRYSSSILLPIILATTHNLSTHPSESRIAQILALGGRDTKPRAAFCVIALMDRLHQTQSAAVALKCLLTLHNIITSGPFSLKEQISYFPSNGGHNFLNLSMFKDDGDLEMLELSLWVRWYASVLEQRMILSRVLGYNYNHYFPSENVEEKKVNFSKKKSSVELLKGIDCLVGFVEQICQVPNSLYLQRIEIVHEVVRLVGEDYRWVQSEIALWVGELGDGMEGLGLSELTQLVTELGRLEACREKLTRLLKNRKRNDAFWELVRQRKGMAEMEKEKKEEKRLMINMGTGNESGEWTRFGNPFLEPGQLLMPPVCSGYGHRGLGLDWFALTVV